MKKFFLLLLISCFTVVYSQQSTNRFDQEDRSVVEDRSAMGDRSMQNSNEQEGGVLQKGPGNPGDPVPIDTYIPLLLLTAIGFIVYQTRKEKNFNS